MKPTGDAEQDLVRVWLPAAASSDCQQVVRKDVVAPANVTETKEGRYGGSLLYFETPIPESGEFTVDVPYEITRHEVLSGRFKSSQKLDDMQRALLLAENKLVPNSGKALNLIKEVSLSKEQLELARQLYDVVDANVTYKKEGTEWGRGDTNWVCDSKFGNCTDFHSLFMTLARSQGLPAKFEIGFSIPTDKHEGPVKGYHCWAWFHTDDQGWVPVDISEASKNPKMKEYYFGNLTVDRVTFSVGRDLQLSPPAKKDSINFLLNPYIEIGGETLATANLEMDCAFKDLP